MTVLYVKITPIDPILFRDNRAAREGEDHVINAHGPSPFTVFGAIGARIAASAGVRYDYSDWDKKAANILGPFFEENVTNPKNVSRLLGYTYFDKQNRLFFPAPTFFRIFKVARDTYLPLEGFQIVSQPGFSSSPFAQYAAYAEQEPKYDEVEPPFLIDEKLLQCILRGNFPGVLTRDNLRFPENLYLEETRMGLQMDNSKNMARKTILFNRPYWRFPMDFSLEENAIARGGIRAWFSVLQTPEDVSQWDGIGILGGDRGRANFEFSAVTDPEKKPLSQILDTVIESCETSKGFFLYLLTPMQAMPPRLLYPVDNRRAVAAVTGKALHMSGWMRANGTQRPRAIKRLLPPGSTFFYEWENENINQRREIIRKHWFSNLNETTETFGFGVTLTGVWS